MEEEKKDESIWKRILVKLTSLKTWIALWAMFMFTYMLITKQDAFAELGWGLIGLIGGDVAANVIQKKINK